MPPPVIRPSWLRHLAVMHRLCNGRADAGPAAPPLLPQQEPRLNAMSKFRAAAALVALSFAAQAHANDVTGAGASFIYPVI